MGIEDEFPSNSQVEINLNKVQQAYQCLENIDQTFKNIFDLVIFNILVTNLVSVAGSCSTPYALGIIWVQPNNDWTQQDIVEALIHEFTHSVLFLDEQRYQHYVDIKSLTKESNWIPSAIRNENRPLNAVAHSILVATELLSFRQKFGLRNTGVGLHGDSDELLRKTLAAISQSQINADIWNLLSPRMKFLINLADTRLSIVKQL
ncbi:hypothetical protein AAC03nite_39130 [Alicyclobacillus acidoterrestris]|nr:hypothetical protein AAC03nite_39130 [Alicyclobacillus acidoterrestris]